MFLNIPPYHLIMALVLGYLLDVLLGDPEGLPHPIRAFGWLISRGEKWLNSGSGRFWKGMFMTMLLCAGVFILFFSIQRWLPALAIVLVYYGLANQQLVKEGRMVLMVLDDEGLEAGRRQLSRIVGRDTAALDVQQIRTAVLETLSENLSDAVIAPLFYYALAGLPGMMTYKMINTMDSMIGYRDERFEQFGKFAARLDDLVNLIPARLTALLMVIVTASARGWTFVLRYGHRHKSPNAGYPEAALAGILDVRFGGPNRYRGQLVEKPFIGEHVRTILPADIDKASRINHRVCLLMIGIILFTFLIYPSLHHA